MGYGQGVSKAGSFWKLPGRICFLPFLEFFGSWPHHFTLCSSDHCRLLYCNQISLPTSSRDTDYIQGPPRYSRIIPQPQNPHVNDIHRALFFFTCKVTFTGHRYWSLRCEHLGAIVQPTIPCYSVLILVL